MKKNPLQSLSFLLAIALVIASCSSSAQKDQKEKEMLREAEKNAEAALLVEKRAFALELENFKKETELKVEKNNQIILELKQKSAEEKKSINVEFDEKIRLFEERNEELKKRLESFDNSKRSDWQIFKAEVSRDFDELGESIKAFFKKPEDKQ